MKRAMGLFGALSLLTGILLIYIALPDWKHFLGFLALGLAAIWAAIRYTSGKNPYGYAGFGDIFVFLFFGIVGVSGTYFLHALEAKPLILLIALSLGCFSTAVLNINNIRDIDSDRLAGKLSIPVRIGRRNALRYHWALMVLGNVSLGFFVLLNQTYLPLLAFFTLPWMIKISQGIQTASTAAETDPYLKKMALSTLIWTLLFGFGLLLV
jgi:1,4-dihydroxy-2-naphthoate octaprenyltransferase